MRVGRVMVQVRDRQDVSAVRERLSGALASSRAVLATPPGAILHPVRDLVPVRNYSAPGLS